MPATIADNVPIKSPANDRGGRVWDQQALQAFKEKQTPERRAQDEQLLRRVFNLAAKVPEVKTALDWAHAHGVEIVVDRTSWGIGGYYLNGTGIVGLSMPAFSSDERLAGIVAHELRHAWQDYHGLIVTADYRLDHYIIKNALIEADATAHQKLAEREYRVADLQERAAARKDPSEEPWRYMYLEQDIASLADKEKILLGGFRDWYKSGLSITYGGAAAHRFGHKHGIRGSYPRNYNVEVTDATTPVDMGIDFQHRRALLKLGEGYGEGYNADNYLARADKKELKQQHLSAEAALRFFKRSMVGPESAIAQQVRKNEIQQRRKGPLPLIQPWAP
jgi:hypothetical protein